MSVPSEKIEAVRAATDIVAWIGRSVSLKKAGRNFVGLCPFHAEKSPSFSVSASKRMYYCFGCHVGGDIFDFVMRFDSVDFSEAARKLAQAAGVVIEAEAPELVQRRQVLADLAAVNAAAQDFFAAQLWQEHGSEARRYLGKRRVPAAFARQAGIGFGGSAEAFRQHMLAALAAKKLPPTLLAEAGLVGDGEGWPLFSGRLTFPIRDPEGRLVGFGGRRLAESATTPKYINSREGALFNKRQLLFGLYEGQAEVRRSRRLVFVEGYMDVLAARRAGIAEAVAAMGTALTSEHAAICRRVADVAFLLLDADAAGVRAAYKAASTLLAAAVEVRIVALPKGEDPDSLVRQQGPEALVAALTAAVPAVEYFMGQAFAPAELSIEARAAAARHLMPLILALPSGLERDLYTSRLADHVGVTTEQLRRHVQPQRKSPATDKRSRRAVFQGPELEGKAETKPASPPKPSAEKGQGGARRNRRPPPGAQVAFELDLLRELLLFPSLRSRLGELAEYMLVPENGALYENLATSQEPVEAIISAHVNDPRWSTRLGQIEMLQGGNEADLNIQANRTFDDILARLKWRHVDAFLMEVLQQIAQAEASGHATDALMRRKQELTARKRSLRRATRIERVRA